MNDTMPSNSNKTQEAKTDIRNDFEMKPVQAVAHGSRVKKSMAKRVIENVFSTDSEVKTDLVTDIVVPAVKNTALDMISAVMNTVTNAFELALFGTVSSRRSRRSGYYEYGRQYRNTGDSGRVTIVRGSEEFEPRRSISNTARMTQDFSDIEFKDPRKSPRENLEDAKAVIGICEDYLDQYGFCPVSVFYRASGITPSYQDAHWGWRSLAGAHAVPIMGGGAVIEMPKPEYVKPDRMV